MKLLQVLFPVLLALCAVNAIPLVPGDNSHYVEGESRYIWMPDDKGSHILVDLQAPVDESFLNTRNAANNEYRLFTRSNQNIPQIIEHGNANSVLSSNYNPDLPTKVIVHGWLSTANSEGVLLIKDSFLATANVNVILVDWSLDAGNINYILSVRAVPNVGLFVGNFITWLFNTAGGNWNNLHMVGFSLGAHVVGNAGRTTGNRPARITGLDPAGPLWPGNSNSMSANDAQYVEVIHTDGRLLGIFNPIGRSNFYPNGGKHPQPGCSNSSCSHGRSIEFFAASVRFNNFVGRECTSTTQAENNECTGSSLNMGNGIVSKRGDGIYGLTTGATWPY